MKQDSDFEMLAEAIRAAVTERVSGSPAVMFSGGLDSAILAVVARKCCEPVLYTLGTEGSHDPVWARECAHVLDLPLVGIAADEDAVMRALHDVVNVHGMRKPEWLSTFVAFDLVLGKVSEKTVLCGQGADELFGGYRKYMLSRDPETIMSCDTAELLELEFPAYERMALNHGKTLLAPYLDARVVSLARELPLDRKICGSQCKVALRDAAGLLGVPGMMALRPKKAMQYGSGVSKLVRACLKELGDGGDDFRFRDCRKRF